MTVKARTSISKISVSSATSSAKSKSVKISFSRTEIPNQEDSPKEEFQGIWETGVID